MDNNPHADSQDELRQCVTELEKALSNLADDNAGVSRCGDERLRRWKAMLDRPLSQRAQRIVYAIGRALVHELMTEIAKRVIETLVRIFAMPNGRVLSYDYWCGNQDPSRVCRAQPARARGARWRFGLIPLAA